MTVCNPTDCSLPGPSVHGILQARTLEWVAISFPKRNYRKKVKLLSHVRLFATPWTVAYQAPPSMEFSRQEYWSGLPFPSSSQIHRLNSNVHCDGIWLWGLWVVVVSQGGTCMNRIGALAPEIPEKETCEDTVKRWLLMKQEMGSYQHQICQCLHLGLPSLQSSEK